MKNYVPTTLDKFINESKSVTLKRGYKNKGPVVVGTNAPLRNQILNFISENNKVTSTKLKTYIAGLNETNANPDAAATMWLRRNEKYLIKEERAGKAFYKLSSIGKRLVNTFTDEESLTEKDEAKRVINLLSEKKKYDFKDPKTDKPGITDDDAKDPKEDAKEDAKVDAKVDVKDEKKEEKEDEKKEETLSESRKLRIEKLIENIKSTRDEKLNEEEEEEEDEGEEKSDDDELTFDDLDLSTADDDKKSEEGDDEGEEKADDEDKEGEEEGEEDDEDEDEKVEITEFVITVDDVDSALEELKEKEIEAERVIDPEGEPEEDEEEEAYKENEISVSAENWEALKDWLEEKGVDVEDMFGGEIEVEDEEDEEDEEGEGEEDVEIKDEEGEDEDIDLDIEGSDELELDKEEGDEVEESLTGMENHTDDTNNLVKGAKTVVITYK